MKNSLVIVALMATIGLMTAATIAIPMLEDRNGHMQTAYAQIDSSCTTWYNPDCGSWYEGPQTDSSCTTWYNPDCGNWYD